MQKDSHEQQEMVAQGLEDIERLSMAGNLEPLPLLVEKLRAQPPDADGGRSAFFADVIDAKTSAERQELSDLATNCFNLSLEATAVEGSGVEISGGADQSQAAYGLTFIDIPPSLGAVYPFLYDAQR